jgi:pyruvate/2-oxoglutarate dehydrogenase complex dihydrolipoamide acyltransferase (E2) component
VSPSPEGTVTRWLKNVGDAVALDEPLLEISTDKVDTEIPSPVAGVLLEISAAVDVTVEVGAELAVVGEASEESAPPTPPPAPPAPAPVPATPAPTPVSATAGPIGAAPTSTTRVVEVDLTAVEQQCSDAGLPRIAFVAKVVADALRTSALVGTTGAFAVAVGAEPASVLVDGADLTVTGVARKLADQAGEHDARAGLLLADSGGSGVLIESPALSGPRLVVLTLGASVKRPVVVVGDRFGDTIALRQLAYLTLVCDERTDGGAATAFLVDLKARLEDGRFTL